MKCRQAPNKGWRVGQVFPYATRYEVESYQISNISFSPCVFVVFLQVTTQSLSRATLKEAIPEVDTVKDEVIASESDCWVEMLRT